LESGPIQAVSGGDRGADPTSGAAIDARAGRPTNLRLPGYVHALSKSVRQIAQRYATETGREMAVAQGPRPLAVHDGDVVVALTGDVDAALMDHLFADPSRQILPGLLCAPSPAQLSDLCRRSSAALQRQGPERLKRIHINADKAFTEQRSGVDVFFGGPASLDRVRDALSERPSILQMRAHGDGITLRLTATSFVCPVVGPEPVRAPLGLQCESVGRCTRIWSWPTFQEAEEKGLLSPVNVLGARIGLIWSCYAFRVPDDVVSDEYGLMSTLQARGAFDAILTIWRRDIVPNTDGLLFALSQGRPIGTAAADFNAGDEVRQTGGAFCLLGDPAIALQTQRQATPPTPATSAFQPGRESAPTLEPAAFLLRMLDYAAAHRHECHPEELAGAMSAVRAWRDSNDEVSHRTVLTALSRLPAIEKLFSPFARPWADVPATNCPICARSIRPIRLELPQWHEGERLSYLCPTCEEAADLPIGWRVEVDLQALGQGRIYLKGLPEGAQGVLCVTTLSGSAQPYASQVISINDLGSARDGALSAILPTLPDWPVRCHFLICRLPHIAAVRIKLRREADGRVRRPGLGSGLV
jgi:hypothetical protein